MHDGGYETVVSGVHSDYGSTLNSNPKQRKNTIKITVDQILHHLISIAALSLGSYAGVTARISLSSLSEWDGISHFPSFWAQIIGALVIGVLVIYKGRIQKRYIVIYTAVSTGFCGSLTTFSSWNVEAAQVLMQFNHTTLNSNQHGYYTSGIGYLTVLLLGFGMPIAAMLLGRNISKACESVFEKMKLQRYTRCCTIPRVIISVSIIVGYIVVSATLIAVCVYYTNYFLLFSLLLGSIGTYIRWQLSSLDNIASFQEFPLGTFLANTLGSIILVVTSIAIAFYTDETEIEPIKTAILTGVASGFCGSLTTVSTFLVQLSFMPFHKAILYALVSLLTSQVLIISIIYIYESYK